MTENNQNENNQNQNEQQKNVSKAKRGRLLAAKYLDDSNKLAYWHGQWYRYTGTHYTPVEDLPVLVRQFCLRTGHDVTTGDIGEIIDNLRGLRYLAQTVEQPSWLREAKTNPRNTLVFKNGLLDLETGTLLPHSDQYFNLHALPYDYDPQATCPEWTKHLATIMPEDEAAVIQEYLGYCLSGMAPVYQKCLMIQGPPRSGKGTTSEVFMAVLGREHTAGLSMTDLANQFGVAQLENKKLAFIDEINLDPWNKQRVLETFNRIVGQAPTKIERKGQDPYTATLGVRFLLACNKIPVFFEATGAFASRLLLIQLTQSFVGREDRGLLPRLLTELSGVCNWAIEGFKRLQANGEFTTTAASRERVEQRRRDSSDSYAFTVDCLRVHKAYDTGALGETEVVDDDDMFVSAKALSEAYGNWLELEHRKGEFTYFLADLKALLPALGRSIPKKVGGEVVKVYKGIGLKPMVMEFKEGLPGILS